MNKFFLCLATALLLTLPAAASASDEGTEKNAQERNGGEKAIGPLRIGMSLREALNLGAREVEPGLRGMTPTGAERRGSFTRSSSWARPSP